MGPGRREILSIDIRAAQTEAFKTSFLRGLLKRGLIGVQLAMTDRRTPEMEAAIQKVMGCAWQHCAVPFLSRCTGDSARG